MPHAEDQRASPTICAAGGNTYLAQTSDRRSEATAEQTAHLKATLALTPQRVAGGVLVTLRNVGAGHAFPTGVTDIKQAWLRIEAIDGTGKTIAIYGGLQDGLVPAGAARLGIDLAQADGTVLLRHEVTSATRVPFDVRVPPGEAQSLFVSWFQGSTRLPDAARCRRRLPGVVRATYYRAALQAIPNRH